jgi:5-methylthioadenosine/S-adenosylhomocysteine deaminase
VTSTVDWSYNLHSIDHAAATVEAMRDSGARVHFAYGPSLAKGWGDFDLRLTDVEAIRSRYFGSPSTSDRVYLWAGLGGPELQPEERFREEMGWARGHGLRVHIHLRENESFEPKDAVERMDRWGTLGPDLLLAHAIHLRDIDLDLLARSGTKVSYNALANMRVADGICRVVELRQRGVDVGIGLDGSASGDTNDYLGLLRVAVGLQRARWLRGDCVTVDDVLQMATIEGARCLGKESEVGSLERGKKADVVLIDPHTLNFMPLNDFSAQLVFCGQPRNVDTVIVGGQVLKRNGELVGVDAEALMAKCQAATRFVTQKADLRRNELLPVQ